MGNSGSVTKGADIDSSASPAQISEFMGHVRPLDLIVFRGGEGVSTLITKLEQYETGRGDVSHVEVAITREWCEKIKPIHAATHVVDNEKSMFSWGSTLSGKLNDGVYDAETGGAKFGVQIRVLEDLVREYLKKPAANVGVCRLLDNPTLRRTGETDEEYAARSRDLKAKIGAAYDKYNGETYDINLLSILGAVLPQLRPLRNASEDALSKFTDANKWLFCSEWAAVLYEAIGVITDATDGVVDGKILDPKDIVPVDFLGADADKDGIVSPICEIPPIWVKDTKN